MRRPPVQRTGGRSHEPGELTGKVRRGLFSCSTASTVTVMSILSPISSRPPSIGMLKSMPNSLREMLPVPSKPTRVPPHGSLSVPSTSTSSVTGLVTPLIERSPVTSRPLPPPVTSVALNVMAPWFSTSKKSAERRWLSRFSSWVLIEFRSIEAVAEGASPVTIWPSNFSNRPRTLLIR